MISDIISNISLWKTCSFADIHLLFSQFAGRILEAIYRIGDGKYATGHYYRNVQKSL
jgi:hypothetical protein